MKKGLGDTHNFGKYVYFSDGWVHKPRPIYWEWLFLNENSPLREFVKNNAKELGFSNPFAYFPNLEIEFSNDTILEKSGKIEFFKKNLAPLSGDEKVGESIGNALAVILFFGLADIHFENLAIGTDKGTGNFVVFPLDIEVVFQHLELLSNAYIVSSVGNINNFIGIRDLLNEEINVASVITSFLQAIQYFESSLEDLVDCLVKEEIENIPIRRIIKPTFEYVNYLKDPVDDSSFHIEELEQLRRGDVPYFFSYIGSNQMYYVSEDGKKESDIPLSEAYWGELKGQFGRDNLLRRFESADLKKACLQIARSYTGRNRSFTTEKCHVKYEDGFIYVSVDGRWKVKCKQLTG